MNQEKDRQIQNLQAKIQELEAKLEGWKYTSLEVKEYYLSVFHINSSLSRHNFHIS